MPKPKKREGREFTEQFLRAMRKLRKHLEASRHGDIDAWQDISVQLFMLLCDRVPVSLAEKTIPDLSLHPLMIDISNIKQNYQLIDATQKRFTSDGLKLELFDIRRSPIPMLDWLDQALLYVREDVSKEVLDNLPWVCDGTGGMIKNVPEHLRGEPTDVTLKQLISEARNQMGGGHFTPTIRAIIQATESIVIWDKGIRQPFHVHCLIAIAEYVAPELEKQFMNLRPRA